MDRLGGNSSTSGRSLVLTMSPHVLLQGMINLHSVGQLQMRSTVVSGNMLEAHGIVAVLQAQEVRWWDALCGTSEQCQSWMTVCNCSHASLAQELKSED